MLASSLLTLSTGIVVSPESDTGGFDAVVVVGLLLGLDTSVGLEDGVAELGRCVAEMQEINLHEL